MKKSVFLLTFATGALLLSGCASKKDLENCQNENRELTANYQQAREQLAASKTRVASLEEQLRQQKRDYAPCSNRSTRASRAPTPTTSIFRNWSIRLMRATNISATWLK